MADDWGNTVSYTNEKDQSYFDEGGRSYGKGRGFIIQNNNNDDWPVGKINSNIGIINESEFNNENYWQCNDKKIDIEETGKGKGRGHGKGGSRGRGGNRGRTGFNNRNKDGDNNNENNDYGNQDNRNDKRKKTFAAREDNDEEEAQKPKEQYIPPELPNDEKSLFENGVEIGINFDKYDNIQVNVSGENVPQSIESFEAAGLRNIVLDNIKKSGYKKPTPVQKHALPIIMNGRDLMACAQTGSGKTAAFAVPIINTLLERSVDLVVTSTYCEPQVVIVSPTRELTIQIWQQIVKFSLNSILKTVVAYGGTSVMHQRGKLSAGCHILVATPGRLLDFVEKGRVKFSSVQFLVLDEADRMLDMGFLPSIEKMVDHETMVPLGERQTLMFSATFPDEVQHLARRFLNNYLFLAVGIVGGACSDVEQNFYEVARNKKKDLLKEILERENDSGTLGGTLVFVEMKKKADFIAVFLSENNYPTTSIHGDRLQRQREEALADFKSGRMFILVATAVAARGLDIKNVSHVINYDLPKGIDEYVHRIGRTGRVGNRGRATSFFDPEEDAPLRGDLVRILKQANQSVPDWLMGGNANRNFMPGRGISKFGGEDVRESEIFAEEYTEEAYSVPQEPEEDW
ncbi:ATP-dependent RNA helicase vasa isoform X2 [Apis cerana]|uniref:ATP-dependent RNA helicase vasa isoform X2 n=1 Tax=Apis cerana TaxID=7461 RepID=UPI002B230B8C|nr:ATP-dependent RNA helicase vasa isoform X2 [Apis cerana]